MTKENAFIFFIILILVSPLFSIGMISKILRLRQAKTYWISSLPSEGKVEIVGKAKGTTILSPLSNKNCLLWKVKVEEQHTRKGNSYWTTVYENTSNSNFVVSDDTGEIPISVRGIDLDLNGDTFDGTGYLRDAIEKMGVETTGFLGFDKTLRATEYLVNPDDEIFINGEIELKDGCKTITSGTTQKLLISGQSEQALLSSLYRSVILITLGIIVVGGVILFITFYQN